MFPPLQEGESLDENRLALLTFMRDGYQACGRLAAIQSAYFNAYADYQAGDADTTQLDKRLEAMKADLQTLRSELGRWRLNNLRPLDYLGGAAGNWPNTLDVLERDINFFGDALKTGNRGEPVPAIWW
jgi:hypothetical protein